MEKMNKARQAAIDRYNYAMAIVDLNIQRVRAINSFCKDLKSQYVSFAKKKPAFDKTTFQSFNPVNGKPLIPGIPGIQTIIDSWFISLNDKVLDEGNCACGILDNIILKPLSQLLDDYDNSYQNSKKQFETAKSHVEKCISNLSKAKSTVSSLASDCNSKKQQLDKAVSQGKPSDRLVESLKHSIVDYRNAVQNYQAATSQYNAAHTYFLETVRDIRFSINNGEVSFLQRTIHILQSFYSLCKTSHTTYLELASWIASPRRSWGEDIYRYSILTGLNRSAYSQRAFEPYMLSFDDPQCPRPLVAARPSGFELPIALATATRDTNNTKEHCLKTKAGEYFVLYETPKLDSAWCCAKPWADGEIGFVPSAAITVVAEQTAVTIDSQFGDQQKLRCQAGEMLIVVKSNPDGSILAKNAKGQQGIVDSINYLH